MQPLEFDREDSEDLQEPEKDENLNQNFRVKTKSWRKKHAHLLQGVCKPTPCSLEEFMQQWNDFTKSEEFKQLDENEQEFQSSCVILQKLDGVSGRFVIERDDNDSLISLRMYVGKSQEEIVLQQYAQSFFLKSIPDDTTQVFFELAVPRRLQKNVIKDPDSADPNNNVAACFNAANSFYKNLIKKNKSGICKFPPDNATDGTEDIKTVMYREWNKLCVDKKNVFNPIRICVFALINPMIIYMLKHGNHTDCFTTEIFMTKNVLVRMKLSKKQM